ncbi:hypothetical protein GCM10018781_78780 [Kitasatospora indigofera]|uniref:Uncharacterized protein n=1 Tax=Kitasatospora indigofera TaxID=67307 RepID=A0A919D9J4_9ACTN|nr:hypothetical protein [Kitasatospora indigofera]GHE26542.1 hypothetical protein GCM10018781_78780 [Kitasatospora indigofera]
MLFQVELPFEGPGHRPDHDRLASLLADPAAGLPLLVSGHECRESDASRCRLQLVAADGRPGEVELLFRHTDEAVINAWETRWPDEFALIRQGGSQSEPQRSGRPALRGTTAR